MSTAGERPVPVMLACNDDYGNLDRLHKVEFGEEAIGLDCIDISGAAFRMKPGAFFVSGARFDARHARSHVRNIYWELFTMEPREAALLLRYLRNSKRWTIDEGVESLYRWWESCIDDLPWLIDQMREVAQEGIRL